MKASHLFCLLVVAATVCQPATACEYQPDTVTVVIVTEVVVTIVVVTEVVVTIVVVTEVVVVVVNK